MWWILLPKDAHPQLQTYAVSLVFCFLSTLHKDLGFERDHYELKWKDKAKAWWGPWWSDGLACKETKKDVIFKRSFEFSDTIVHSVITCSQGSLFGTFKRPTGPWKGRSYAMVLEYLSAWTIAGQCPIREPLLAEDDTKVGPNLKWVQWLRVDEGFGPYMTRRSLISISVRIGLRPHEISAHANLLYQRWCLSSTWSVSFLISFSADRHDQECHNSIHFISRSKPSVVLLPRSRFA